METIKVNIKIANLITVTDGRIIGAWNVQLGMELEHNLPTPRSVWVTLFVGRHLQTWRRCDIVVSYPAVLIIGCRAHAQAIGSSQAPNKTLVIWTVCC
jgi:hypothetical protein